MATINYTISRNGPVAVVDWADVSTADTATHVPNDATNGSVQFTGTWGGATATLKVSNDATTWFQLQDVGGTPISATNDAIFEFATVAKYIRPEVASGSGDDIDVSMTMRA